MPFIILLKLPTFHENIVSFMFNTMEEPSNFYTKNLIFYDKLGES